MVGEMENVKLPSRQPPRTDQTLLGLPCCRTSNMDASENSGEDFWDSEYRFRVCERLCDGGVKAQSTMGLRERVRGLKILDFASLLPRGGEVRPSTRTSVDCMKYTRCQEL